MTQARLGAGERYYPPPGCNRPRFWLAFQYLKQAQAATVLKSWMIGIHHPHGPPKASWWLRHRLFSVTGAALGLGQETCKRLGHKLEKSVRTTPWPFLGCWYRSLPRLSLLFRALAGGEAIHQVTWFYPGLASFARHMDALL